MHSVKMNVNNKLCDVVTMKEFVEHGGIYDQQYTAMHIKEQGLVLPVIGKMDYQDGVTGMLPGKFVGFYNMPADTSSYLDTQIIDFRNAKSMKQIIETSSMVKNLENKILENSDNVTNVRIDESDTAEMAALKEAVNLKECDLNVYAGRFDGNFPNDRRILSDSSITLAKLKKFGNALDMKITLTIGDREGDVPNPIGKTLTVELTGGVDDE